MTSYKILVTGGCGFIGSWIVDALIKEGYDVIVIDNLSSGSKDNLNKKAKLYNLDIQSEQVEEVFKKHKPDYVFHTAAEISVRDSILNPIPSAEVNIIGTLNILNNCVKYKTKKFIFSSTGGAIYGEESTLPTLETEVEAPESPYGISKLSIEKYLSFYKKVYGLDYVALRYGNVFGPRQNHKGESGVIALFTNQLLSGERININGTGGQTRDYCYVKDVAKANVLALKLSGIFNVGTGKETSVNELCENIQILIDSNELPKHNPPVKGELMRSCLDSSKLMNEGWKRDYTFSEGLEKTVDFFKVKGGKK